MLARLGSSERAENRIAERGRAVIERTKEGGLAREEVSENSSPFVLAAASQSTVGRTDGRTYKGFIMDVLPGGRTSYLMGLLSLSQAMARSLQSDRGR